MRLSEFWGVKYPSLIEAASASMVNSDKGPCSDAADGRSGVKTAASMTRIKSIDSFFLICSPFPFHDSIA